MILFDETERAWIERRAEKLVREGLPFAIARSSSGIDGIRRQASRHTRRTGQPRGLHGRVGRKKKKQSAVLVVKVIHVAIPLLIAVFAFPVHATIIRVDFTVALNDFGGIDSYAGFPVGTTGVGSFAFDSSLISLPDTPGSISSITAQPDGLPGDVEFSFLGQSWTPETAGIAELGWCFDGVLCHFLIGGRYRPPDCANTARGNLACNSLLGTEPDFWLCNTCALATASLILPGESFFAGANFTSQVVREVAEPPALVLLLYGVLVLLVVSIRVRRLPPCPASELSAEDLRTT